MSSVQRMITKHSQASKICGYLATGKTITALEALHRFSCWRLAARICQLRSEGHRIDSTMIRTKSGARVAVYRLNRS